MAKTKYQTFTAQDEHPSCSHCDCCGFDYEGCNYCGQAYEYQCYRHTVPIGTPPIKKEMDIEAESE